MSAPSPLPDDLLQQATHAFNALPMDIRQQPAVQANKAQLIQAFALSDFIRQCCCQQPAVIAPLLALSQQAEVDYATTLASELSTVTDEAGLLRCLRQFRNLHMLRLAWRDLLNMQSISDSLCQVSELAEQLIWHASQWLYHDSATRYGYPLDEQGNRQPLLILGMGKLGGGELNFSSDVDLIFVYNQSGLTDRQRKPLENQQFFTRLGQKLIQALDNITADGQVFRVDMRLRPLGDSGPLVMHLAAFEDYYQEQGRDWERYAMLKARVLGPSSAASQAVSDLLKPFVYRRYLDFGAIEALRQMKQLIVTEVRRKQLTNNIKLGQGGIREVEFVVQCLQLIRAGRQPQLQTPSLLSALEQIADLQLLPQDEVDQLKQAYLFMRKLEHCLQQFADQQTQQLPDTQHNQARLCQVMHHTDYPSLLATLSQYQQQVHCIFIKLIGDADEPQRAPTEGTASQQSLRDLWLLDLVLDEAAPLLDDVLAKNDQQAFFSQLQSLKTALVKKTSQKGQDALQQLMPSLLQGLLTYPAPLELFSHIHQLLVAIAGRSTYLQLLASNQGVQQQLLKLCAASPWIAKQLALYPLLLDELINPQLLYQPASSSELADLLRQQLLRIEPEDLEQQMECLREFKLSQQLRIAAADVTNALDTMQVSDHLTELAEVLLAQACQLAWPQISEKYGCPNGCSAEQPGLAILAYGKLGGHELGYASDLDLVFVHQAQPGSQTTGPKVLDSGIFYVKLVQRILHLFTTKTRSGQLYEVDLRLRPAGNAGLLVSPLPAFADYQQQQAWVWEHQALVRARCVFAQPEMQQAFKHIRHSVLCTKREQHTLANEIVKMRNKMRQHLLKVTPGEFDLKQSPGGITDIEFLVQYWVLSHANASPQLTLWPDNIRILNKLSQNGILPNKQANALQQAYLYYRQAMHRLSLQQQPTIVAQSTVETHRQAVLNSWQHALGDSAEHT